MAAPEPACRSSGGAKLNNRFYYQNHCILNQKDALVRGCLKTPKKVANKKSEVKWLIKKTQPGKSTSTEKVAGASSSTEKVAGMIFLRKNNEKH